jgi:hypothetical protein
MFEAASQARQSSDGWSISEQPWRADQYNGRILRKKTRKNKQQETPTF